MECPDIDLRSALDLRAVHRGAMRGASTDPEVDAAVRRGVCLAARPLILRERFFRLLAPSAALGSTLRRSLTRETFMALIEQILHLLVHTH